MAILELFVSEFTNNLSDTVYDAATDSSSLRSLRFAYCYSARDGTPSNAPYRYLATPYLEVAIAALAQTIDEMRKKFSRDFNLQRNLLVGAF
ncbi:hypothetical protein [Aliterella atlantica]|uniref:Uncharacterized protein n=1 Tax=Aliterella atlantica CENA595 TaxID=1618023 RepID=A0A0D8ZTP0_9CYAN|nr:hypothetical protein [Aliterella atlantica]KJH70611.1 hypothetical protein UH38_17025 [Aliterella atlantica CENA595]